MLFAHNSNYVIFTCVNFCNRLVGVAYDLEKRYTTQVHGSTNFIHKILIRRSQQPTYAYSIDLFVNQYCCLPNLLFGLPVQGFFG